MSSKHYYQNTDASPTAIVEPLRVLQPMPHLVAAPLPEPEHNIHNNPEHLDDSMDDEEPNEGTPASEQDTGLGSGTFKSAVHWKLSDDQMDSLVNGYTNKVLKHCKFIAELHKAKREYQQSLDTMQKARRRYMQLFKSLKKNLVLIDKF